MLEGLPNTILVTCENDNLRHEALKYAKMLKDAHVLMSGTPREIFARAEELLSAGLDVPQVTHLAMALRKRGLPIDPAVYTAEELERQLAALKKGGAVC